MSTKSEDVASFIAHVQGDGSFSKKRNCFRYFNTELVLIKKFRKLVLAAFDIKCGKVYSGKSCYHIGFSNKNLALKFVDIKFGSSDWFVPKFVTNGSPKIKQAYLQSFFDDEGTVTFWKKKWGYDRDVRMQSLNYYGLKQLQSLLLHLNITSSIYGPYKNKYFELKIMNRKNLQQFLDKVGFIHPKKIAKLIVAIHSYK